MHKKTTSRTCVCEKLLSKKKWCPDPESNQGHGIFSPLLYLLSYLGIHSILFFFWWAFRDLNPGPAGYEPDALTN